MFYGPVEEYPPDGVSAVVAVAPAEDRETTARCLGFGAQVLSRDFGSGVRADKWVCNRCWLSWGPSSEKSEVEVGDGTGITRGKVNT